MYDYRTELPAVKQPAPRGIRNNNPGNIEAGQPWQGLANASDYLPDQQPETRFAVFQHPKYGIRAMVKLLRTYQSKYKLGSVYQLIGRYAPSSENNTMAYAVAVANHVDVGVNDRVDMGNDVVARRMVEAIIQHENGMQPYPDQVITDGLMLAGMMVNAPQPEPVPTPPRAEREPDQWVKDENGKWLPVYYDVPADVVQPTQPPEGLQQQVERSTVYKLVARFVPVGYGTYSVAVVGLVVGLADIAADQLGMPRLPFIDYSIDGFQWVIGSLGLAFLRRAK